MVDQEENKEERAFRLPPLLGFIWAVIPILFIFSFTLTSNQDETALANVSDSIAVLSFWQIVSVISMLVIPAFIISYFYKRPVSKFLNFDSIPSLKTSLLVAGIILSSNLFLNYLIDLNALIPLSDSLADKFKHLQEVNESLQNQFLDFQNPIEFILVFLVMAIIPALSEELYFRGLLEGLLFDMKIKPFHTIFISSLLFAMMHFEFEYFLALLYMGGVLGYIYYRTKNLWYSILAHFLNNGLLVVLVASNKLALSQIDLDASPSPYVSIVGFCTFALLIYFFHKKTEKTKF